MFLFKKIVSHFLFPYPLSIVIILAGLTFLWLSPRHKLGKIITTFGVMLLLLFSYEPLPNAMLHPLEYEHMPLLSVEHYQDVKWIVVLGDWNIKVDALPAVSRLSKTSLARLAEGIRLYRMLPERKILLSGGVMGNNETVAEGMYNAALELGINPDDIVLEKDSKDTKDEAVFIKEMLGVERFILVTSASHMPRSLALFRNQGMDPIPSTTDFLVKDYGLQKSISIFPSTDDIAKAKRAVYEYLGIAWAKLRGQI